MKQKTVSLAYHKNWKQLAWLCPAIKSADCKVVPLYLVKSQYVQTNVSVKPYFCTPYLSVPQP